MSLSEIRVNTTKTRTGVGTITYTETGPVITGIATASNFKTGSTNVHSTGVEVANINTSGSTATFGGAISGTTASFSGTVSIGGTLTYEDVTNIDAVGIITAKAGIHIDDSITHIGDTDTKIRFPGADQIQLDTGGTNYLKLHRYASVNFVEVGASASISLANNGANARAILIGDANHTSTGRILMQAGAGSQGHGGAVTLYSHANSTNAGGVYIGKSLNSSGSIIFGNGGTSPNSEYLRIDSSGRIIAGRTASDPTEVRMTLQGNSASATSYTVLDLRRGEAADAIGDVLGYIRFSDTNITSGNQNYALIYAQVDKASTNASDNPGRLVFATTRDGAAGPSKALTIDSDGKFHTGQPAQNAIDDFNITALGTGATLSLNRANTGNASDGDLLGALSFQSYPAGQGYTSSEAGIRAYAATGQSGSAAPTELRFYTKPSSVGPGAGAPERLRITPDGKFSLGDSITASPAAVFHIDWDSNNLLMLDNNTASTQKMFFASQGATHAQIYGTTSSGAVTIESDPSNNHSSSFINFKIDNDEVLRISSGGGHSIWNNTGYYAANLTECNSDSLALNVRKTRGSQTKGIALGAIGSSTHTTIQGYDTSDNSANALTLNPYGGQVVINTTSPVSGNNYATVHVGGDASSSGGGNVLIGNLYNSGLKNPKNCQLTLAGQHNSTGYNADGQVKLYITGSDNDSGVNYPIFMENENAQVQMVARQNGTDFGVGIGSATPASDVDVCGSAPEIRITNTATSRAYLSWYNHYGGVNKNANISYNEGNANWEFKLYRADGQANSPYGNIQFFTGSTSSPTLAMNITRPGSVTMPKQPCCVMYASSSTTWSSGWTKIPLNNTRYDVGNNFDSSNNRYSIPVTGKYAIGYNVEMNIGSGQTWIYLVPRINRNDTTSTNAGINYADFAPTSNNSSNHYYCHQGHWIASLSQGDTVTWETHGAGNAWTIANNNQSHYYIYQVA